MEVPMKTIVNSLIGIVFISITVSLLYAREMNGRTPNPAPQKNNSMTEKSLSNIGNMAFWFWNDGISGHNPYTGSSGVTYPRTTAHVIYREGIVWGGITQEIYQSRPQLRVGGNTYRNGTQPGWYGGDPNDERARIYRIRKDWASLTKEDVRQDAAELNNVPPNAVTNAMLDEVLMQYKTDWKDWPVDLGAPYYDADNNGMYNPVLDSTGMPIPAEYDSEGNLIEGGDYPGIANADQVLWFVINDDNEARVNDLAGSPPLGLEIQTTVWAYNQPQSVLSQAVFKKYKIINKSSYVIDSMFVAQWSDPDLGDYSNDLVGCDSLLECAYVYNGYDSDAEFDEYGLAPPAVGYLLLQGPIVPSPGDSAWFDGQVINDYKNLPMTSFSFFGSGTTWSDPVLGDYDGTLQWYNLLRGYSPTIDVEDVTWFEHTTGPQEGQKTKFPLNGDPVAGTGDIDGVRYQPGDRRLVLACGPFDLAPDEVQEFVVAAVGGQGTNRLTAITDMKTNMKQILKSFGNFNRIPKISYSVEQPSTYTSQLFIEANLTAMEDVTGCEIQFNPQVGTEASFTLRLYDDGLHNDRQAGDGYWAADTTMVNKKYPFDGDLNVHFGSDTEIYENFVRNLRLRPVPELKNWQVIWENGKQDRKINHSETVHLQYDIHYPGMAQNIDHLTIRQERILNINQGLSAGGTISADSLYFVLLGPSSGDTLTIDYSIQFDYHTVQLTTKQPVYSAGQNNHWMDTVTVVPVVGTGKNVSVYVADQSLLTAHTYAITFHKDSAQKEGLNWNLTDLTSGTIKLQNQPLADDEDYPHPVVDGLLFQVSKPQETVTSFEVVKNGDGPLDPPASAGASWQGFPIPDPDYDIWPNMANGSFWFIHTWPNGSRGSFDAFMARTFQYTGGYGVADGEGIHHLLPHDFEIRFTGNGKAFDNWFTETVIDVPFELWDIGDVNDPDDDYQLVPYIYDYDTNGEFNLLYDAVYPDDPIGWADHEVSSAQNDPWTDPFYWIHPTDNTPGSQGYNNMIAALENDPGPKAEWYYQPGQASGAYDGWAGMHRMVLVNWNGGDVTTASSPSDYNAELPDIGSVFRIVMAKPNFAGDSLLVYGPTAIASKDNGLPKRFRLEQNYPNPFNPLTTIRYALPRQSKVTLEVFNVLGQKVAVLVNGKQPAGVYSVQWDASRFATGLYILRIKAGNFVSSKKMLLVK
ncbi:MAG TPA: T9SS type A sorting domain-containing protein [Caldithrix abyssi]|uniref:T9SS type A sorting domain-containing protein n=1 Tax=Caldithrix abyssi TaxID=187145 RepID=A0A7V4U1E7_CALAY|nr:T9SS type A sorting domain-containing protein [Caldithrix abyssi]